MKKENYLVYIPLYLVFSFLTLVVKLRLTPAWFNGNLVRNHKSLLEFTYTNNEQSRILQFQIPEFFHQVFGFSIVDSYMLQRWLFVALALIVFHVFLRAWFSSIRSFACVMTLLAIMPYTYMNHLQESAPLLMLTFILGLWAIREGKAFVFSAVLFVGVMNNETMLILAVLWLFCRLQSFDLSSLFRESLRTFLIGAPALAFFFYIRYLTKDNPHLGEPFTLYTNLSRIQKSLLGSPFDWYRKVYLGIFFVFGPMWIFIFMNLRTKPEFFKRCLWFLPFFIVPHFLTGVIYEVRQMIPLAYIVIPMTFMLPQKSSR